MTILREVKQESKNKEVIYHYHPRIVNCQVSKEKITVELEDQREVSLPTDLIIKEIFCLSDVKKDQLENYKI